MICFDVAEQENVFYHSSVLYNGKIYVFGGVSNENVSSNFFSFDPQTLKIEKLKYKNQPSARMGHTSVLYKDKMIIYGGIDIFKSFNEVYSFDLNQKVWERMKTKGGSSSDGHSSFIYKDYMYVYGGEGNDHFRRLNLINNKWEKVEQKGKIPSKRQLQSITLCGDRMYLFGGKEGIGSPKFDFYFFDLIESKWNILNPLHKQARYHHSSVIYNGLLYIFGGFSKDDYQKNMIIYDFKSEHYHKIRLPIDNVSGSSLILSRNQIILLGCEGGKNLKIFKFVIYDPFEIFHFHDGYQDVLFKYSDNE